MVGQFSLAFAITTPIFMMTDLDLRSVLVTDFQSKYNFGHYLGLRLLTIVPALIAVSFLSLCQKTTQTGIVILLVGIVKTFEAISDLLYGKMQQKERLDKLGLSLILKSVLSIVIAGLLLYLYKSMIACTIGLAASYLIVLLVYDIPAVLPYGPLRICIDRNIMLQLLRLSLPLGIVLLFVSLNKNLSAYFIDTYLGSDSLGYYASIIYIMTTGSMAVSSLGQAHNARLAKLYGNEDIVGFMKILRGMVFLVGVLSTCMILTSVIFGGDILLLLYSREYSAYQNLFIFIMVAAGVSYIGEVVQYAVTATRQFKLQPFVYGLVLLMGLGINPIFIARFNLIGAAGSIFITSCLQLGVNTYILYYMLHKQKIRKAISGERKEQYDG
jgi:O-antigen/teichoic acid export membrane protein